jgi:hypothetical protein
MGHPVFLWNRLRPRRSDHAMICLF